MANNLDLSTLFSAVTGALSENKTELNQADSYNNDHGDKMVQMFDLITNAVAEKKKGSPAEQLSYASKVLGKASPSGTAEFYVDGLANASQAITGNSLTAENALPLVQALLGASGGAAGAEGGGINSLLGGLLGGADKTLDAGDLLSAGLTFLQSKQQGDSNMEAIIDALIANSPLGQTPYRAQSGSIVASTILQTLGALGK